MASESVHEDGEEEGLSLSGTRTIDRRFYGNEDHHADYGLRLALMPRWKGDLRCRTWIEARDSLSVHASSKCLFCLSTPTLPSGYYARSRGSRCDGASRADNERRHAELRLIHEGYESLEQEQSEMHIKSVLSMEMSKMKSFRVHSTGI